LATSWISDPDPDNAYQIMTPEQSEAAARRIAEMMADD
jgi:hypothetical protein